MVGSEERSHEGRSRRWSLLAIASVTALVTALVLAAGAGAYQENVTTFSGPGSEAGRLSNPGGVAVSPDGTRFYVADTGNQRVAEYSAEGEFIRAWGWGVEDGEPELQTCTNESQCYAGQSGTGAGELNQPVGVAADENGIVYVVNRAKGDGRVQVFDTAGAEVTYAGALPAGYEHAGPGEASFTYPLPLTDDVAVDPDGNVYVADNGEAGSRVFVFDSDRELIETIPVGSSISALSVTADGTILLGYGGYSVAIIEPEEEPREFATEAYTGIFALTLDPRSGNILVEQQDSKNKPILVEYTEAGEKLATIPVTFATERPSSESIGPFGLAVDPFYEIPEGFFGSKFGPGVIYVIDRFGDKGVIIAPRAPKAPKLESVIAETEPEAADVSGQITPTGADTHVYVEYGTTAGYGSSVPAAPGLDVGSAYQPRGFAVHLAGLSPNTTYHYSVVATNAIGTTTTADATFTTFGTESGFSLPDGRAWEQVSTEKGTNSVEPRGFAAPGGDGVVFGSLDPLPVAEGGSSLDSYAGLRGPEGWHARSATPATRGNGNTLAYSRDLGRSVVETPWHLLGSPDEGPRTVLYLKDIATGALTTITPYAGAARNADYRAVAAATDFSHFVFQEEGASLTPDTPENGQLSVYDYSGGSLRNVGVLPGASAPTASPVRGLLENEPTNVVSEDGSRIFFTTEPAAGGAPQVFVRIDGSRTVEVSASQAGIADPEGSGQAATFVGASGDGSEAFFTSSARLTDDADTGSENGEPRDRAANLYRLDLATGALSDLTLSGDPADEELGAAVANAVISGDGEVAYFSATGNLAPGASSGRPNLYRWQQGEGVTFVGTLDAADAFAKNELFGPPPTAVTEMTSDGSTFVFESQSALDPAFPGAAGATELYRFAAGSRSIACVSCARAGGAQIPTPMTRLASVARTVGPHLLSADGARVFFQTSAALVAADTNRQADIYEWEGGAARLVSSGSGDSGSTLIDASSSGDDVFFTTVNRLVASDQDGYVDVYDARVGGGFPEPAAATPCGEGDCRPAVEAATPLPVGSRSFDGPPNKKAKHHRKKHHRRKKHRKHGKHRKHSRSHGHPSVGKRG